MKKALFAGSFDPVTLGHVDLIERASKLCDELIVGIAKHPTKNSTFSTQERVDMLQKVTQTISHVRIVVIEGLVASYAQANQIDYLIRGCRSREDMEIELAMAWANRKLAGVETLFLRATEAYVHISASLVRELASYGASLKGFVPEQIESYILRTWVKK